jgi:hypothetical protein
MAIKRKIYLIQRLPAPCIHHFPSGFRLTGKLL